jgi:transcriptional regulator with XRE-family HTH domain
MKGITQKDMAARLGVSPRYIGHIEQGHRGPSLDMQVEICKFFGISMSELVPVLWQDDSETKERWIAEIVDGLRTFDADRVGLVKTMVRCMGG